MCEGSNRQNRGSVEVAVFTCVGTSVPLWQLAARMGLASGVRAPINRPRIKGPESNRIAADQFAAKLQPLIRELQASGVTSQRAIARELERLGVKHQGAANGQPRKLAAS